MYVNDAFKGQSPVTYDFLWYGWQRVTVSKTGYQRIEDRKFLQAPAYLWIPCDMVMELLPVQIHDERSWSYTLIPHPELPTPSPPSLDGSATTDHGTPSPMKHQGGTE